MSTRTSALDTVVFGVDVQSGDVRGDAPSYALVVFDGEVGERTVVSRRKLLRRIAAEEPDVVATDNMYELAEDKQALIQLLRLLPDTTRLVQVTGDERPEPLSRVASRHGVPYGKDPMEEAEAAARLAARSVGFEVSAFTDTTVVKVSRGRSTGKGGWSEDRYTRRIHGAVRRRTRDVKSTLEDSGLEFELDITEKYGGYSNAVFTVEASPSDIPVSGGRSGDTRVVIEPERRDGIEFRALAKRRDPVVVGVDPGTTTGVAVVDLDGVVLDVLSTRTADTPSVIEWIVDRGRPVVIAADVTPMPETVGKIYRSFDAAGWTPERDLPVDEKLHRTRDHGYDNDHERDALAAALFAFDEFEDRFARVIRAVPPEVNTGRVIARVLSGDETVDTVVRALEPDDEPPVDEPSHEPRELTPEEQRIKDQDRRIERLESHVAKLTTELEEKTNRITELEAELSDERRAERRDVRGRRLVTRLEREKDRLETELAAAEDESDALRQKLERLKSLWHLDHSDFADIAEEKEGLVPVKPIDQFTLDSIEKADAAFGLAADDVILLRDASGAGRRTARRLAEIRPRVVLKHGGLSREADEVLFEHDIPVGSAGSVAMQEIDDLAVAREADVEAVIDDWSDRANSRTRDRNAAMVDRLISEHRSDRRD